MFVVYKAIKNRSRPQSPDAPLTTYPSSTSSSTDSPGTYQPSQYQPSVLELAQWGNFRAIAALTVLVRVYCLARAKQ
ncbi:hypothetical protein AB3R30_17750 [Leptolyngbyaceae cyanobacterium UHCC 1019]